MTIVASSQWGPSFDQDSVVFFTIMMGQRLSAWQLLCEHSWRPSWKSSKV